MTSIMTNTSAMSALATLRSINQDMETTQDRISSGFRVGSASDNAAYWSIATTMRSDNKALGTVQDALGLGAAKADVAYTAMNSAISVVDEIKAKFVAASEPGVDRAKVDKEIKELQNQLVSIAKSASFSGENWVAHDANNTAGAKEIVGSFNRDGQGNVSLTTLSFDTTKSSLINFDPAQTDGFAVEQLDVAGDGGSLLSGLLIGNEYVTDKTTATPVDFQKSLLTIATDGLDSKQMAGAISAVDVILQKMTDSAADLGALNSRIGLQSDFVADLSDSIEKGIGKLVDADMNEESTRLKALQTQQQLGIQALSIANSASQNILSLFR
ncbi:flagellin [Rhizobium sp. KVB221]|uniref:Flagellin n=1 Tax=Rhizobium setariae TaxID=2801340 RepID=A0A936YM58_9HYPH|nr:flagellin [Rhizobium setariae]MBL0370684.1 flagellin [Rhizobium setariae]